MSFTDTQREQAVAFFFPRGAPPLLTLDADFSERALRECNCALDFLCGLADLAWDRPDMQFSDFVRQLDIPEEVLRRWWAVYYLGGYEGLRDFIFRQDASEFFTVHFWSSSGDR